MCTQQVPVHMAVLHEEIASMLLLLDGKQGKDLEKLVKKHKGAIQGTLVCVHTYELGSWKRRGQHKLMEMTRA